MSHNSLMYLLLNLVCILSIGLCVEWPFRDCGRHEIKTLRIEPCDRKPCNWKAGDSVNITVEFVANHNTDDVKLYGSLRTGGLFDVEVPYIGIDDNACNRGFNKNKLDCPVVKGQTYRFTMVQTVPYTTRFNVFRYTTWKLVGNSHKDLTCAEFDIYQDIALNRYFSQFAERK